MSWITTSTLDRNYGGDGTRSSVAGFLKGAGGRFKVLHPESVAWRGSGRLWDAEAFEKWFRANETIHARINKRGRPRKAVAC